MLKSQSLAPESRERLSRMQAMDLSDISRERTLVDLAVARARVLDLTFEIDRAAAELAALRAELPEPSPTFQPVNPKGRGSQATLGLSRLISWRRSSGEGVVQWHVDEICGELPARSKRGIEQMVRRSDSWILSISGWVVPKKDSSTYTSARLLMAGSAGVISRQASIHLRDDVAAHFGNPAFAMSGFRFEVPMSELEDGFYTLHLLAFSEASGESRVQLGRVELV
jgi:hypothetical protein